MRGNAIERARQDVAEGRNWKARDRLFGLLSTDAANPEALDLLGEVYSAMGDAPRAAGAWLLAGRSDPASASAYAALEEQTGGDPALILRALPIKGPVDRFPDPVRRRIRELAASASTKGGSPRRVRRWLEPEEPRAAATVPSWPRRLAHRVGCLLSLIVAAFFGVGISIGLGIEFAFVIAWLRGLGLDPEPIVGVPIAGLVIFWLARMARRLIRAREK